MSVDTETVMAGLLSFLQAQPSITAAFPTIGRRVQHWSVVSEQPALLIRCIGQDDVWQGEGLDVTELDVELWIYSQSGQNPDAVPETGLNQLVSTVRAALAPPDIGEFQTLNNLVYRARIEGRTTFDPGDLDGQSKATISLKLMLPTYP